jgi:hypothetical protein
MYKHVRAFTGADGNGFSTLGKQNGTTLLSAYALIVLAEVQEVAPDVVDAQIIKDLRAFLLTKKTGSGSFKIELPSI